MRPLMWKVTGLIAVSLLIVALAPRSNFGQTSSGSNTPATNIGNDYSYFLKNVNSQQVVNDLRNGQWTTTVSDPNTNTSMTTTEALPTGKMGWGNVKISLALAQHSLNQQGILQPTSEQLHTALMGGQMVQGDQSTMTTGILQMRADGMGWGQIAQKYNVKLGQLMSRKQPASTTTTTATNTTTTTTGKGIVTGSGKSAGDGTLSATGKGNGKSFAESKSQGNGIVSASGKSVGTSSNLVSHSSRGIVSGSGRSVGHTSGIVTGGGNGHGAAGGGHGSSGGHGKGHSK